MNSMTGYGRGDSVQDGFKLTVEVSAVNRKQSEIALALPRELEALEARVRDQINRRVARGRLTVRVVIQRADPREEGQVRLNRPLARAYARELAGLARELKLSGPVTLETLLRAPGVIQNDAEDQEADRFWPALENALNRALESVMQMRRREGAHLAKDLKQRVGLMRKLAARVRRRAPTVARRYQRQLHERIRQAGLQAVGLDDERLLKEVVLFADRSDITEELTRLQSHFHQFDECVKSTEPVGRQLDFLAQEINREVNTIGSKANDGAIAGAVVTLKAELEKFREQAQNVE